MELLKKCYKYVTNLIFLSQKSLGQTFRNVFKFEKKNSIVFFKSDV